MKYTDKKGRTIYAGAGSGGDKFMTLCTKDGVSNHRLKSSALPIRNSLAEAEADLAAYARSHSFEVSNDNELEILTHEIIIYKNKTAQNFIEIGKRLKIAKSRLKHGEWLDWLRDKVEFTPSTAQKLIQCADTFSNTAVPRYLSVSKMFELISLPTEKRNNFIKDNDVKNMSWRQLRQAVKAEKNADKITTTATIETVPDDDIDIPADLPVIDSTYSFDLINKIKDGYISLETAAKIARKFPSDYKKQEKAMIDATVAHQQAIAELDEDSRPQCAFVTRHVYRLKVDGKINEADIYTAQLGDKHYLYKITCWQPIDATQFFYQYPCRLIFYKSSSWEKAYESDEDATKQGKNILKHRFNSSLTKAESTNFTLEITPEIASQINKSNADTEIEQSPSEIEFAREVLIANIKASRKQHIANGTEGSRAMAAFCTLLVEYLQNIDSRKIKTIMEES